MIDTITKLKEIYENCLEGAENIILKSPDDLDFCNLMFKSASNNLLYNIFNSNLCMFNCDWKNQKSIFILFGIPFNSEKLSNKEMSEKIMEIVDILEKTFVTLDYVMTREVKEDRFVYLVIIKKNEE